MRRERERGKKTKRGKEKEKKKKKKLKKKKLKKKTRKTSKKKQVGRRHEPQRRWDAGFRITVCAATPDQAAFVLSVPRRRPVDETQETLRTSAFPSTHVKDKWARNLYIAGVAYGRTVS